MSREAHPGSIDDYPLVIAVAEPKEILIKKGNAAEVTVSLTYRFNPVFDAPTKVIVQLTRSRGQYLILQAAMQLNKEDRTKRLHKMHSSGEQDSAFFDKGQFVSYPNSNPLELNAGETKSIIMRITIPDNIPYEMLDRPFIVNPNFTINPKGIGGMVVGTLVKVVA